MVGPDKKEKKTKSQPDKIKRKRWTQEENKIFYSIFNECLQRKVMPRAATLKAAASKLPGRSTMVIRVKVHNLISGKQKMIKPTQ